MDQSDKEIFDNAVKKAVRIAVKKAMKKSNEDQFFKLMSLLIDWKDAQDEQTAKIINAINRPRSDEEYEPCEQCGTITTKPYRTNENSSHCFCCLGCQQEFVEDNDNDRDEEAHQTAEAKMNGVPNWDEISEALSDNESYTFKGVTFTGPFLEIIPDEEQRGVIIDETGKEKWISYANEDASFTLLCVCDKCKHKFEEHALKLLKTKKKHCCPACNGQ